MKEELLQVFFFFFLPKNCITFNLELFKYLLQLLIQSRPFGDHIRHLHFSHKAPFLPNFA